MNKLYQFVEEYGIRGDCECGQCVDQSANPTQPEGHAVDITFFKVAVRPGASGEVLRRLVLEEAPTYLDGKEHNYLEVGGDIGDQGAALMLIGMGHLLGLWKALSPATLMSFMPRAFQMEVAGMGGVSLQAPLEAAQ